MLVLKLFFQSKGTSAAGSAGSGNSLGAGGGMGSSVLYFLREKTC